MQHLSWPKSHRQATQHKDLENSRPLFSNEPGQSSHMWSTRQTGCVFTATIHYCNCSRCLFIHVPSPGFNKKTTAHLVQPAITSDQLAKHAGNSCKRIGQCTKTKHMWRKRTSFTNFRPKDTHVTHWPHIEPWKYVADTFWACLLQVPSPWGKNSQKFWKFTPFACWDMLRNL